MKKLLTPIVIICVAIMTSIETMAEEIVSLSGKPSLISLEKKIQTSFDDAKLVVLGTFEFPVKGAPVERLSDEESFKHVKFSVNKIYKGNINVGTKRLKIPVYSIPVKGAMKQADAASIEQSLLDIQNIERELENGQTDNNSYLSQLTKVRMQILNTSNYSSEEILLVPIKRGGLDVKYRLADVPIMLGKKYILFIFRDVNEQKPTPIFSWELDLYSTEQSDIKKRVVPLIEKLAKGK